MSTPYPCGRTICCRSGRSVDSGRTCECTPATQLVDQPAAVGNSTTEVERADNDQQRQDCTPVAGADVTQPVHIFAEHGTYNVELTVTDEDSSATQTVRVEVRDVDPVIGGLDEPESAYEIAYMPYTMNATPGAPGDPIIRYEWDINPAAAAADPDPGYAQPTRRRFASIP